MGQSQDKHCTNDNCNWTGNTSRDTCHLCNSDLDDD